MTEEIRGSIEWLKKQIICIECKWKLNDCQCKPKIKFDTDTTYDTHLVCNYYDVLEHLCHLKEQHKSELDLKYAWGVVAGAEDPRFWKIRNDCKITDEEHPLVIEYAKRRDEQEKKNIKVLKARLSKWGNSEQKNNNIYRKTTDELNEDWLDKIEEVY